MKYPEVTSLFKYRSINELTIEMLVNMKIWCAQPSTFNDPFECAFDMHADFTQEDHRNHLLKHFGSDDKDATRKMLEEYGSDEKFKGLKALQPTAKEKSKKAISKLGIFSLSEDPLNILMWAHYADDHKGICIEFERAENNPLGNSSHTGKVTYSKNLPRFSYLEALTSKPRQYDIFLTKSEMWSYEKEWRLVMAEGNQTYPVPAKIISIIFGLRTPDRHQELIYNIMSKHDGIKFKKVVETEGNYQLLANELQFNVIPWNIHKPELFK